jgi:spore coat protein H
MNNPALKHNILVLLGVLILLVFTSCGSAPEQQSLTIKEYNIVCNDSTYNYLIENYSENNYIPITINYNGKSVVAKMRVRGDSSRKYPKKSLKIKFDSLQIEGLPKVINLNAEYEDKTYVRQYLSSKLMQQSGQMCFSAEHVKVLLNGKFLGLYLQIENMDKAFLKRNNLSPKGNLYKATKDGACLSIFDNFDEKWEKKTNKKSDHSDLLQLIEDINYKPNDEFEEFIRESFNYDEFVNMLALNMFMSNNSTYYHNYYLYHDLYNTGKWTLLPWDMDKTLSYYNWMPYTYHRTSSEWESDNPLIERSLLCPAIFKDIQLRITDLHEKHLNDKAFIPLLDSLQSKLTELVEMDTTDQINKVEEWKKDLENEKQYFNNHFMLLQQQFNNQPHSFYVERFDKIQTDLITFKWKKSHHPKNKEVSYVLSYGTDFLLKDSSKTTYISNLKDSFYSLKKPLPEGEYYWKVAAYDGTYYTDGFNTKNKFEVKIGTPLPKAVTNNLLLKKEHSPYVASKNTSISANAILTIEPGVEVHFPYEGKVECYGRISAIGTKRNPIKFIPQNSANDWDNIFFLEEPSSGMLKNVFIKDGTVNCTGHELTMDSCTMIIDKKDIGENVSRKVLLYTNKTKVLIKNSTFKSNGYGEGMVLFYSDVTTENCSFDNIPDAIEYIGSNKGIIRNNYVTNSPDDAIDLNACNNILIEGNFLFGNIDKAISIGTEQYGASIKNIVVRNNLIVRNNIGIAVKDSSVAHLSHNTFFKNNTGITCYRKRGDYKIGGMAIVDKTILEKNKEGSAYADSYSRIKVSNTIETSAELGGKNNIKGDPRFVNAKGNDYHVLKDSPCNKKDGTWGAFPITSRAIGLSKIHNKSSKDAPSTDWIELLNFYNVPLDLSLYKILITSNDKTKEYIFPIGSKMNGLERLTICSNYKKYAAVFPENNNVLGGLPKLENTNTTIELYNQNNYLIASFSYKATGQSDKGCTFISNDINHTGKNTWQQETE